MKKLKEKATNHPYFTFSEKKGNVTKYHYKDENEKKHILLVSNTFKIEEDFPVDISAGFTPDKYPNWLAELEWEMNELYFKENKVRMLIHNDRRTARNIIWYHSLKECDNIDFYDLTYEVELSEKKINVIDETFLLHLENIRPLLEKEKYTLDIQKVEDGKVFFLLY
jgi:hypothetical protein